MSLCMANILDLERGQQHTVVTQSNIHFHENSPFKTAKIHDLPYRLEDSPEGVGV